MLKKAQGNLRVTWGIINEVLNKKNAEPISVSQILNNDKRNCSVSTPPPSGRFGYYVLGIMEVPSRERHADDRRVLGASIEM